MFSHINIAGRMQHHHVVGLSISSIHHDKIEIENYGLLEAGHLNKVDNNTIFNACSISKFLTTLVVLTLAEQDILDLDEDVNKRLTSWKIPHHTWAKTKAVTLRNLLCHQGGVIDPEGSFETVKPLNSRPSMADLLNGKTPYCPTPIEITYEPGSKFHYSDAGFCIIQQLIEDVTEKPYEQVVEELIFTPLNMKNSTFSPRTNESGYGNENVSCGHNKLGKVVDGKFPIYPYPAAAGLWTTTSDLSQLMLELFHALHHKSKLGISAATVEEMLAPQGGKNWTGLGVFRDDTENGLEISSLGWGIGFQCMLVAYPHSEKGLIIMTNTDLGVHQLKGIIGEIYHAVNF